jgi:predicted RNA-binding Zn-ribbon protein involved in translation (DUF1610 family)
VKKHYLVSRHNLTNCPSCMSHITPTSEDVLGCPFCGAEMHFEQEERPATFGGNVMSVLKSSRSAALAAMLGASLSMTACDLGEPEPEPDMGEADMPMNQALYGVPAVDMDEEQPDMPVDQPVYGAPATDMDDEEADLEPPAPAYGLPPQDMG